MQGLILAAGMGKRLKALTRNNTKCMVEVNGVTLIQRMLSQLEKLHLSRVVIVVGYEGQKLIDYIETLNISTPICYVNNPIYDKTNNIYSLSLAKDYLLKEDTLLLESDLIFEDSVLRTLIEDPRDTLALVDKYESWMDGTCVKISENDTIEAFVPGKKFVFEDIPQYYKTVNIYKFSKRFSESHYVPFLDAYSKALGNNEYYEQVLRVITMLDDPEIKAKRLNGQLWYEIDDIQDLDIASSIFTSDLDEKLSLIQSRCGGYWRYPKLLDFSDFVNPYFPPQKLMDEMKANFESLITSYPSTIRVNCLLAAKNFGVQCNHILVGNGASELIKCLMEHINGNVGFISSIYGKYFERYEEKDSIVFEPNNRNFSYTAEELITYFSTNIVETIVLANPDNISGNYIPQRDVLKFAEWCKNNNIKLILDESFTDFADEENATLIDEEILGAYNNLIVIKSVSKSHGVPGVRLGIMVSADENLISVMKKEVGRWNINSLGEFYLQIEEKYHKDYQKAILLFKEERSRFISALESINNLRIIPTQSNNVMIEITGDMTARDLARKLLTENILIKELPKNRLYPSSRYICIAIKNQQDNDALIKALKNILI